MLKLPEWLLYPSNYNFRKIFKKKFPKLCFIANWLWDRLDPRSVYNLKKIEEFGDYRKGFQWETLYIPVEKKGQLKTLLIPIEKKNDSD